MQKTTFASGFSPKQDCGNELLAFVIRRESPEEFRRLDLKDQVHAVHNILHQIWGYSMRAPEYPMQYVRTADATLLADRLGVISESAHLEPYLTELLALSWYLSSLAAFPHALNSLAVQNLIRFQTRVVTLLPEEEEGMTAGRANLRLNALANLALLYTSQLRGKRPMLALVNLQVIQKSALDEGVRHDGSPDLVTRPGMFVLAAMLEAAPRISKSDRVHYRKMVEAYYRVIETLAGGILADDSELGHAQKHVFGIQLREIARHPHLGEVPSIKKSIADLLQLFGPPAGGARPN